MCRMTRMKCCCQMLPPTIPRRRTMLSRRCRPTRGRWRRPPPATATCSARWTTPTCPLGQMTTSTRMKNSRQTNLRQIRKSFQIRKPSPSHTSKKIHRCSRSRNSPRNFRRSRKKIPTSSRQRIRKNPCHRSRKPLPRWWPIPGTSCSRPGAWSRCPRGRRTSYPRPPSPAHSPSSCRGSRRARGRRPRWC